jgi:hypothetical protein
LVAVENGVSIFLILMGAILAFAVELSPPGIDLRVVGVILLVVGGMSLIIAFLDRIGLVSAVLHRIGVPLEDRNAQGSAHDSGSPERPPDDSPPAEPPDQRAHKNGNRRACGSEKPDHGPPPGFTAT